VFDGFLFRGALFNVIVHVRLHYVHVISGIVVACVFEIGLIFGHLWWSNYARVKRTVVDEASDVAFLGVCVVSDLRSSLFWLLRDVLLSLLVPYQIFIFGVYCVHG
jgi:hypothetical protein